MFHTENTISEINNRKFNSFWSMFLWTIAHIGILKTYKKTNFKQIGTISDRPNRKKLYNHYKHKTIQRDHDSNWLKKVIDSFLNGINNSLHLRNSFIDYLDNTIYVKIVSLCKILIWGFIILLLLLVGLICINFISWLISFFFYKKLDGFLNILNLCSILFIYLL
jgi:hypothetical protein